MNQTGDLLMKFMLNNNPIKSESQTDLTSTSEVTNKLMEDFVSGKCFEIDSFSFNAGTAGSGRATPVEPTKTQHDGTGKTRTPLDAGLREDYKAWRNNKDGRRYPVDLQPIRFKRSIDSSSTLLIQNCIDCVYFDGASLIKRKPTGNPAAGEAYLRLDFTGVLVIGVDWDDDEDLKETYRFICRGVTIRYRPQLPNGSLGAVTSGSWNLQLASGT
jgi:type VI protein secretion system component Hcp